MNRRSLQSMCMAAGLACGLALPAGCQTPPRPERTPGPEAAAEPGPSQSAPAGRGVAERPASQPGVTPPIEPAPQLPDYLEVVELFHDAEPARVAVQLGPPDRLAIDTRNVRRLRIDRRRLPLDTRRSIVLRLDDQGIEWTADSTTFEFERSPNGAWSAVKHRP